MKEEASEVFKSGKYTEAIEAFNKCLEFDPLNAHYCATILLNISICQDKLGGDKRECLHTLNKSIKYNPKYAKALVKRGDMHVALEDYNEAIRDFSDASDYDSNGFNVQAKLKDAQSKAKKSKRKDYYKILGVPKDSQDPVIHKAYKKLALKWHPDKNTANEEQAALAKKKFQELNEAKNVLLDKNNREKYDQGFDLDEINSGRADHGHHGGGGGGGMGGIDPNDLLHMFMAGGMGGGGGGQRGGGGGGFPGGGGQQGFTFKFG
jgi:DnaJ family protein C protein 7